MFEDWAGKAIPKEDTASICFRNQEYNNKSEYINYTDKYVQQKNNAADTKPQNREFDYEKAKNDLIIDYPKLNPEYPRLFPGDKIMIKPFDKQKDGYAFGIDAKNMCGKIVTIKGFDETIKTYQLKEICFDWHSYEFDFNTLIRANTNNYQDITNPTQEDFNNLQLGDMVLLKSIEDCYAQDWYLEAQNCCNNWVKINSLRMENFYSAENDNGNSLWIYFEYISAIRKKV
ncbi:MAG: hypothetical protein ACM34J_05935 [Ignavibacteria bacterium]